MIIKWRQQTHEHVCGWLTRATGPIGELCDGVPTLWKSVSPIVTYIPRAGAGQGEGADGAGGGGRGEAAQLRDAAVFGWATWVKWDRRQRRKTKKKERWRGGEKQKQSVWHTLERESSLASMRQGGAVREGEEEEGGSEAQTAVLVQETGSMQAEAEHDNYLLQVLRSTQQMD